jgi:hypothetical protein
MGSYLMNKIYSYYRMNGSFLYKDNFNQMPDNEQLKYILDRCNQEDIEFMTYGGSGLLFKLKMRDDLNDNDYKISKYDPQCSGRKEAECYSNIKDFMLKLVFIGTDEQHESDVIGFPEDTLSYMTQENFLNEHTMQLKLYNKIDLYGSDMLPPILCSKALFVVDDTVTLPLEMLIEKSKENINLRDDTQIQTTDIGIICMGFLPSQYRTLYDIMRDATISIEVKNRAKVLGMSAHIMFMYYYEAYHGDPHMGNILINLDEEVPYKHINLDEQVLSYKDDTNRGRAILIDFGRSRNMNDHEVELIDTLYKTFINLPTYQQLSTPEKCTFITEFVGQCIHHIIHGIKQYPNHASYNWFREWTGTMLFQIFLSCYSFYVYREKCKDTATEYNIESNNNANNANNAGGKRIRKRIHKIRTKRQKKYNKKRYNKTRK